MGYAEIVVLGLMLLLAAGPLFILPRLYSAGQRLATGSATAKRVAMPPYMKITNGAIIALCQLFLVPNAVAGFRAHATTFETLVFNLVPTGWWMFVLWSVYTGVRDAMRQKRRSTA